jgi:hypothetical protein
MWKFIKSLFGKEQPKNDVQPVAAKVEVTEAAPSAPYKVPEPAPMTPTPLVMEVKPVTSSPPVLTVVSEKSVAKEKKAPKQPKKPKTEAKPVNAVKAPQPKDKQHKPRPKKQKNNSGQ